MGSQLGDRFREKAPKRHYRYLFNRVPCNIPNDRRYLKSFDATVQLRPLGRRHISTHARTRASATTVE